MSSARSSAAASSRRGPAATDGSRSRSAGGSRAGSRAGGSRAGSGSSHASSGSLQQAGSGTGSRSEGSSQTRSGRGVASGSGGGDGSGSRGGTGSSVGKDEEQEVSPFARAFERAALRREDFFSAPQASADDRCDSSLWPPRGRPKVICLRLGCRAPAAAVFRCTRGASPELPARIEAEGMASDVAAHTASHLVAVTEPGLWEGKLCAAATAGLNTSGAFLPPC